MVVFESVGEKVFLLGKSLGQINHCAVFCWVRLVLHLRVYPSERGVCFVSRAPLFPFGGGDFKRSMFPVLEGFHLFTETLPAR